MTDSEQTIPVPVELLKELKDTLPITAGTLGSIINRLAALIPAPPKVGDVLTATQVYDLPVRSTFVDDDGDSYVVHGLRKIRRLTNAYIDATDKWDGEEMSEDDAQLSEYKLTITHLPTPRD